jgi:hypothetical protein
VAENWNVGEDPIDVICDDNTLSVVKRFLEDHNYDPSTV